jgi:hypothetical protein
MRNAFESLTAAIATSFALALSACAAASPTPSAELAHIDVPVLVKVYCSVPELERPLLPIASLGADASPADAMRMYASTVALLKGVVRQRDVLLAGCRAPREGEGMK